jgi:hypothetical protein
MSRSPRVVWRIFATSLVATVAALVISAAGAGESLTPDLLLYRAAYIAFGMVGALIVSRQPSNRIGVLALATGIAGAIVGLSDALGRVAYPVPGQAWAAWIAQWGFSATLAPPLMLVLLFPSGHLPSRRWRIVAWLIAIGAVLVAAGNAFTPRMAAYPAVQNPVGIPSVAGSLLDGGGIGWLALIAGAAAVGLGLIPRLRRARGIEREQLKWITFAAALQGVAWLGVAFDFPGAAGEVATYMVFVTLLLVPVAIGIAILRYRLYDIDLIINRTLVYGALTAILAAAYVGTIGLLQVALSSFTAQNQLAVAASTLLVAALFQPLRAAIQRAVDRRFYRRKYDAAMTLEAFGVRLRSHVDLETLRAEVVAAARDTVQPRQASLWLRQTGR